MKYFNFLQFHHQNKNWEIIECSIYKFHTSNFGYKIRRTNITISASFFGKFEHASRSSNWNFHHTIPQSNFSFNVGTQYTIQCNTVLLHKKIKHTCLFFNIWASSVEKRNKKYKWTKLFICRSEIKRLKTFRSIS